MLLLKIIYNTYIKHQYPRTAGCWSQGCCWPDRSTSPPAPSPPWATRNLPSCSRSLLIRPCTRLYWRTGYYPQHSSGLQWNLPPGSSEGWTLLFLPQEHLDRYRYRYRYRYKYRYRYRYKCGYKEDRDKSV